VIQKQYLLFYYQLPLHFPVNVPACHIVCDIIHSLYAENPLQYKDKNARRTMMQKHKEEDQGVRSLVEKAETHVLV
jgi:hypothetical protein